MAVTASDTMAAERVAPNVLVLDYLDVSVGGETRTNIYFYQASQFAFQKHGLERNPSDNAVQFKEELIQKRLPPGSGVRATYRFHIEQQVPPGLSIVIERPDLYVITCNGQPVTAAPGAWWLDKAFGRIDLAQPARIGENTVTLSATPFTIYHELEPAYLLGEFSLRAIDSGFVVVSPAALRLGYWNEQGLPFYAEGVRYHRRFNLGNAPSGVFRVRLAEWRGSVAKVLANGKLAGFIGYPPWQLDVTEHLWNGENEIEVIVIGTLKNTLGPHHGNPALGTAWPGMFQKAPAHGPPAGAGYHTVGYGLAQPFVLERAVSRW
jgi:hypothetical protein